MLPHTMIKGLLVFAALILSVMPSNTQVAQAATLDIHNYVSGNCNLDESAGFQNALNALSAQGGTLDLGTSCIRVDHPVRAVLPNSAPTFGTIRGDGPELAVIHCANGIGRCLEFDQWWFGTMSGFSVIGGGSGQLNAGDNRDFGVVLSNSTQDLGTCCGTISNVTSSGFARCWMFGDDVPPFGAAAEFTLTNVSGNNCGGADGQYGTTNGGLHCGGDANDPNPDELARYGGGTYWFGSYNTLDFVFEKPGTVGSGTTFCMGYGGPGQVSVVGGGSTNNQHELNLRGDCTSVFMTNYRAEGGSNADGWTPILSGGCPGQKLTIVNSTLRATTPYTPISIQIDNGDTQTYLVNNNLVGQVQMVQGSQTVYAYGNTILTQGVPAFGFSDPNCCGQMLLFTAGNRNAQSIPGMWVTDWWPDNLQGMWLFPPNSDASKHNPTPTPLPVSTPVPPTATPRPASPTATATTPPTATPSPTSAPATSTPIVCSSDVNVRASKATPEADAVSVDLHLEIPVCR